MQLDEATEVLTIPISMNSGPASNVSIKYGFQGPLLNVDAACATAAHSIGYTFHMIRNRSLQAAVTGAADSPLAPAVVAAWAALRAGGHIALMRHALAPGTGDPDTFDEIYAFGFRNPWRLTFDSVMQRDYPVVLATTALSGLLVIVGSLLADLLQMALDPRLRDGV